MSTHRWADIDEQTRDDAIAWHVRLSSPAATEEDYSALADWMDADPKHAAAYLEAEALSARLEALKGVNQSRVNAMLANDETRRPARKWLMAASGIAAATILATVLVTPPDLAPPEQFAIEAQADRVETAQLSDGTALTLAPGAVIEGTFDPSSRHIARVEGVAFFDVAADQERAFTVTLQDHLVTVVGTQFEVRAFADMQSVSVTEGLVTVTPPGLGSTEAIGLPPGKQLVISDGSQTMMTLSLEDIATWRGGHMAFDDTPLRRILNELNAFYGGGIFAAPSQALDDIRLSGLLIVSDAPQTARRLTELLPIDRVDAPGPIAFERRGEP